MKPRRAVDAHEWRRGEAQHGAVKGLQISGRRLHHFDEEQDPDPHKSDTDPQP